MAYSLGPSSHVPNPHPTLSRCDVQNAHYRLVKAYQSARAKEPERFKDNSDFTANVLTESAWPPYVQQL